MPRKDIPNSKMYQATFPLVMHEHLRAAAEIAAKDGGQVNLNKIIVQRLYDSMRDTLNAAERREIEAFIKRL
jgi:hypothetical protein